MHRYHVDIHRLLIFNNILMNCGTLVHLNEKIGYHSGNETLNFFSWNRSSTMTPLYYNRLTQMNINTTSCGFMDSPQ